jgi:hypothetical protein
MMGDGGIVDVGENGGGGEDVINFAEGLVSS